MTEEYAINGANRRIFLCVFLILLSKFSVWKTITELLEFRHTKKVKHNQME